MEVDEDAPARTGPTFRSVGRLDGRGTAAVAHETSITPEAHCRVKQIRIVGGFADGSPLMFVQTPPQRMTCPGPMSILWTSDMRMFHMRPMLPVGKRKRKNT